MDAIAALDILIVDDHEAMRTLLRKVLERAGAANIRDAASGADALALLAERPAALILADQSMPGMDGTAFVARVRADPVLAGARIVMITGRVDAASAAAATAAGADAVLVKPIAPRDLLSALNRVLAA
jgi:two-component system chemotaxis response regulator CheY